MSNPIIENLDKVYSDLGVACDPYDHMDHIAAAIAEIERLTAELEQAEAGAMELDSVAEVIEQTGGWWSTCSGCFDSVDGHPTGPYSHSKIFGCAMGAGCDECGGIGVTWTPGSAGFDLDDTDEAKAAPVAVPDGWKIERYLTGISVILPNNRGMHIEMHDGHDLAHTIIYGLVDAMLNAAPPAPTVDELTPAARAVLAERRRQIEAEGWTPEHDDGHESGEMAAAAASYAMHSSDYCAFRAGPSGIDYPWPWDWDWFKSSGYRRDLEKAGALILAEIERLDRLRAQQQGGGSDAQ